MPAPLEVVATLRGMDQATQVVQLVPMALVALVLVALAAHVVQVAATHASSLAGQGAIRRSLYLARVHSQGHKQHNPRSLPSEEGPPSPVSRPRRFRAQPITTAAAAA